MASQISPVVVGYDFSHSGRAALRRAVTLAGRAPFHVLHVVCVVDPKEAALSIEGIAVGLVRNGKSW